MWFFLFSKGLMIKDAYDTLFFMNSDIAGFGSARGGLDFSVSLVCVFVAQLCCLDESRLKHMLMDAH